MTLDQLVEAGARAAHESQNGPWEFLSEEGADAVRYEFRAGLVTILPLLANDLAGVVENNQETWSNQTEGVFLTPRREGNKTALGYAQAIRNRITALMETKQ